MPDLRIDVRPKGNVSVIEPIGYINAHTARDFENVFQTLIEKKCHNIVVNCRSLAYIASAGLGAIMGYVDQIRECHGDIRFCSMTETVFNIFDVLGFTHLYSFFDNEELAVLSFQKKRGIKQMATRMEETVQVQLPSKTRHLHAVRTLARTIAESMGFGAKDSETTALAVEEALTNVIEHAYHGESDQLMRVIFEMEGDKLTVRILHHGDQLDSIEYSTPDELSHFYKQKKKGGLGVLIMKRCMDEVIYKSGPAESECCMIKYLRK